MFERWREQAAVRRVSRRLAEARRAGRGIYVGEWTLENLFDDELDAACEAGSEAILVWCRETMGRCRRPWGIDYFDLALSAAPEGAVQSHNVRFRELRPGTLYDGELAERLACYLAETLLPVAADVNESPRSITIAAGLFSWGEAAFAALPAAS